MAGREGEKGIIYIPPSHMIAINNIVSIAHYAIPIYNRYSIIDSIHYRVLQGKRANFWILSLNACKIQY